MTGAARAGPLMTLSVLVLSVAAFGQARTYNYNRENTDPVVCFDKVWRDARNSLQAYQIALGNAWAREGDCRTRAPAAPELGPCWNLLLQARPLIEQAAALYERARRTRLQKDAAPLIRQGNAVMRRANELVQQVGDCFQPVFTRWEQNGGRYLPGDEFHAGSGPSTDGPPAMPPPPPGPPSRPPRLGPELPRSQVIKCGQRPPWKGEARPGNIAKGYVTSYAECKSITLCLAVDLNVGEVWHRAGSVVTFDLSYAHIAPGMSGGPGVGQRVNVPFLVEGTTLSATDVLIAPTPFPSEARQVRSGSATASAGCYAGGPDTDQKPTTPSPRFPGRQPVCDLQRLAAIVFQQYGPDKPPIAIYTVRNRPPGTYLVALQGLEPGVVGGYDVSQAWLSGARTAELALAYNMRRLAHGDDQYRAAILDAVQRLPRGRTPINLMLAGHSAGGIEAQNLVDELTKRGFRVERVITFGSPITADKVPSTRYTYVKSQGDPVAWLDQRTDLTDTVLIPSGPNANPFAADGGSHFMYPNSRELSLKSPDFFDTCLDLVFFTTHGLVDGRQGADQQIQPQGTNRWLPCAVTDFGGNQPLHSFDPWSANPSWTHAWATKWQNASQTERTKISESIGEAGVTAATRQLGYTTLLSSGQASQRPQGFDAVYKDRDGTLVIAEAKGSAPATLNSVIKFGYNCRQGTMGWAWRAAEATLTSTTSKSAEQRIAQTIMNSIRAGARVRVEVFLTEHVNGVPQVTKHYLTASYP